MSPGKIYSALLNISLVQTSGIQLFKSRILTNGNPILSVLKYSDEKAAPFITDKISVLCCRDVPLQTSSTAQTYRPNRSTGHKFCPDTAR